MKINDLKIGMKNVTIQGQIIEKSETSEVYSRYGYNVHRVSKAILSDGSGSIKLVLWNDQIDVVRVDNTVSIENGYVTQFRGETQLNIGKRNGKLSIIEK